MATDPMFATIDDLKDRWPDFPEDLEDYAVTLLGDASQFILEECPAALDTVAARTLKRITCSLVRRHMEGEESSGYGTDVTQESAGPFSISGRSVSPYGDFILSPRERKQLGCGRQRFGSINMLANSRAEWDRVTGAD